MSTNPDRVPTDAELLAAVAEGDPEAFGVLYDQHAPWLLVRLRQRTTNQDLADQVAQETFLVVWREAGRFRGRGEVGAWIWGIAIRRLLDAQRGAAAQGRLAGLLGRQRIPDAASAEEQALVTLEHREVIRALNRLSPELQAVLQATVLDGLSTLEAAALLAVTLAVAAAGSHLAPERRGGVVAAPALLTLATAAFLLPARVALYAQPGSAAWDGAHQRWAMLLGLALAAFALASRDPAHRRLPSWLRGLDHWLTRSRAAPAEAGRSGSPDAAGQVERSVG
jgi:RNA polymerase sigma-70 factor (ECF subfamily)